MAEVVGGIDWAIELKRPSTPIFRGNCDGHCLFDDDKIHTKILEEHWRRMLKEHSNFLNRRLFPRGREAAVEELEKKIEEAG
jgi:hypothetical protein